LYGGLSLKRYYPTRQGVLEVLEVLEVQPLREGLRSQGDQLQAVLVPPEILASPRTRCRYPEVLEDPANHQGLEDPVGQSRRDRLEAPAPAHQLPDCPEILLDPQFLEFRLCLVRQDCRQKQVVRWIGS
jgi:hypothetical protein